MYKKFLSWDCAHRTLAWSYFSIDLHIFETKRMLMQKLHALAGHMTLTEIKSRLNDPEFLEQYLAILQSLDYFVGKFIQYHSSGVVDVAGDLLANVDEVTRAKRLYKFLQTLEIDPETKVLIEYQPPRIGEKTNNKSTTVSHMLLMYYINNDPEFVSPKLKTSIALRDDLTYDTFLRTELEKIKTMTKEKKQRARYNAQKKHSKANFIYLLEIFGLTHILKGVSGQVLDDLAESTLQTFAYINDKKLF